jgi:HK97 family phage prohead protease
MEISTFRHREAEFRPQSVDEVARTIEVVWSTGARAMQDGYVEELSMEAASIRMGRLQTGRAPFLRAHQSDLDSVLGVVAFAEVRDGVGIAKIRFCAEADDPAADIIWKKIKSGIISGVSVGYRVYRYSHVIGEDGSEIYLAVDWEPYEISLVSIGADENACVRAAEIERGIKMDEEKRSADDVVMLAERDRGVVIRKLIEQHSLGDNLADELIERGVSREQAREIILEKIAERSQASAINGATPSIEVGEDDRDKFFRGALNGILARSLTAPLVQRAVNNKIVGDKLRDAVQDPGEYRRMTLVDLAREFLERSGIATRRLDRYRIVERALGQNTTSDFAILLGTAMHKILLSGYGTTPDTWSAFCGIKSVTDFRDHYFYRSGSFGALDSVLEGGELHHKTIPDGERVAVSVTSKGNIIGISRKAIIDDDLSSFSDLAVRLGRAAALSIESAVYSLLAENSGLGPTQSDSSPFFDGTARGNVGSGAAISVTSIDADRVLMAEQKDPSGNDYLGLKPSILLVPSSLGGTAKVINGSQYDPDTANKLQRPNMVNGLYSAVVDTPRISGTRRYSFADPMISPAIVVAFLEGQQSPTIETQNGWTVDGVEWRVLFDFGVKEFDYRAAITNAGV